MPVISGGGRGWRAPVGRGLGLLVLAAWTLDLAPAASDTAPSLAAAPPTGALQSYALAAPDLHVALPARLAEVSGVTALSDTEVACVQDEDGVVFVFDLARRRVTRQMPFGPPGDYEDIARMGSRLFVLRSDGALFDIQGLAGTPPVKVRVLRLPTADNEGLCLDERHRRLLIAPKSRLGKGRTFKDTRAVFAFDLERAALQPEPVIVLSVDALRAFAERQGRQAPDRPQKGGGKPRPVLRFMPSALAVHPVTSEIFVVSAIDRVLATFDMTGGVTGYAALDPGLFRQPEGLTFLANGDLVITNEAAGGRPTLLLFKQKGRALP